MSQEISMVFDPGDVTLRETEPFKLGNHNYVLREATGTAATQFRNKIMSCSVLGPDGKVVKVQGLADVEPFLVSLCLFKVTTDKEGNQIKVPLKENDVKTLPDRIVKKMFKQARDMSELEDDETMESLVAQREFIDSKIKALEEASKGNSPASEPNDTTDGLGSPLT